MRNSSGRAAGECSSINQSLLVGTRLGWRDALVCRRAQVLEDLRGGFRGDFPARYILARPVSHRFGFGGTEAAMAMRLAHGGMVGAGLAGTGMETAVLVAAAGVMSFMVFPFVSYMWTCNKFVVCITSSLHPRARSCSVSI